jgi:single-strand DNA-binding protein
MLNLFIAGNVGKDAEHKTTGNSELCNFSVAVSVGYGENKQTVWVDVTKWGKGAQGLAGILKKGSRVAVSGEMSMREYNGKTYVQCRADNVTILGTPQAAASGGYATPAPTPSDSGYGDLDDDTDLPF